MTGTTKLLSCLVAIAAITAPTANAESEPKIAYVKEKYASISAANGIQITIDTDTIDGSKLISSSKFKVTNALSVSLALYENNTGHRCQQFVKYSQLLHNHKNGENEVSYLIDEVCGIEINNEIYGLYSIDTMSSKDTNWQVPQFK